LGLVFHHRDADRQHLDVREEKMIGALANPPFDEQSARIVLYILFREAGEVWGYVATADEKTRPDGDIGYRATVTRHGRPEWEGRTIWAGDAEDAGHAKRFSLDVARLHAIDLVLLEGEQADPGLCRDTLDRFRRSYANTRRHPITGKTP
jgi:hypothetical protein